jgi:hypothetical protein
MKALLGLLALAVVGSSTTAPNGTDNVQPSSSVAFDAIVRELGKPIPFDRVFADARAIPRFKDEFETSAQFEERRAAALAKCQQRYLIEAPVDPEYVRYDADKQVLIVAIYALTNTSASSDELSAVFGYGSELSKAGAEVKYDILGSGNVIWPLPRREEDRSFKRMTPAEGGGSEPIRAPLDAVRTREGRDLHTRALECLHGSAALVGIARPARASRRIAPRCARLQPRLAVRTKRATPRA